MDAAAATWGERVRIGVKEKIKSSEQNRFFNKQCFFTLDLLVSNWNRSIY